MTCWRILADYASRPGRFDDSSITDDSAATGIPRLIHVT